MRIALITDFGTRDPYVAAMKGVIAAGTDAPVIDLTHEVAPFDAWEAAFFLRDIVDHWPGDTVFVIVVDPGVGTSRRILCVESRGKIFLAPDNGALHFIDGPSRSVENEQLFRPDGSTTFHGRDRFAPVAAALANGAPVDRVGPPLHDRVRLDYDAPSGSRGTIVRIDRFGNAVTDLRAARGTLRTASGATVERWSSTYSGEGPFLIVGSTGCVEISCAQASAAALLHLRRGERVDMG